MTWEVDPVCEHAPAQLRMLDEMHHALGWTAFNSKVMPGACMCKLSTAVGFDMTDAYTFADVWRTPEFTRDCLAHARVTQVLDPATVRACTATIDALIDGDEDDGAGELPRYYPYRDQHLWTLQSQGLAIEEDVFRFLRHGNRRGQQPATLPPGDPSQHELTQILTWLEIGCRHGFFMYVTGSTVS